MKFIKALSIIILVFLISCKDDNKYEYFYYQDGSLEYEVCYFNEDSCYFDEYNYSKKGKLNYKQSYKDCKRHGKLYYYDSTNLWLIKPYKNDSIHGVVRRYSKVHPVLLSEETFVINGIIKVYKEYVNNDDLSSFAFNNFSMYHPDSGIVNGYLAWDKKGSVIPELSHYYHVLAADTLSQGEKFNANISFVNQADWDIRLELGEMDENLNFIEKPVIYEGFNKVDISITPTKKGDNLLMGKLYVSPDSIEDSEKSKYEEEFIFYHEFYVKEKDSWRDFL